MKDALHSTSLVVPVIIVSLFIVAFAIVRAIVKCWNNVPPNMVAVVSGRNHGGGKGYRVVKGGGFFKIPVIERVDYLSLNLLTTEVEVRDVPDENGALLTVKGVANVKVNSDDQHLHLAIERFLGSSDEDIKQVARQNLEGNLRGIVGTSAVEMLIKDRHGFQTKALNEAGADMQKLGLTLDLLNIHDIQDKKGYIDSLGRARTAQVIRDATIGEAEAKRETDVKSAEARQLGAVAQAQAEETISNAERQRDMIKAENKARVDAAQARVEIVAQTAVAEERKSLNVAEVAAEQARVEAETRLQSAKRARREAELNATTIVEAEKLKEARIIAAEGAQQAAEREGEASRIKMEKEGMGEQAKMTAQAQGRIKQAEAVQAEKEANAAGDKAQLLAAAAGKEADLLAEAKGREAILLAEAKGTEAKAEAFRKLDEAGKFLLILEGLPPVITSLGDAASKVMVPMAEAIGEGLSNVDEIRLIDFGNNANSNDKGNVLSRFLNAPPETMTKLVEQLKATQMMPVFAGMLKKAGIDVSSFMGDGKPDGTPVAVTPAPASPALDQATT